MIFKLYIDKQDIIIETDDKSALVFLEHSSQSAVYNPYTRSYVTANSRDKIYYSKRTSKGIIRIKVKIGWGIYLINAFKQYISLDDRKLILDSIYSQTIRSIPFPNLRDYQNIDILHMLKYKYGLFQCYTGYGKSEIIATLTNYAYSIGKSVLLLAPNSKCVEELVNRCRLKFNLNIPSSDGRLNIINTSGVIGSNRFKKEDQLEGTKLWLSTIDWVLCDEVEYVVSPGGRLVLDMCCNSEVRYGFSGTADKTSAHIISFIEGLSPQVMSNKSVIDYFGQSLIYRVPTHLIVNLISIDTNCFSELKFNKLDINEDSNVYMEVMNKVWTDHKVCNLISELPKRFPKLFIPVNNLVKILSNWIDNYWIKKWRILLISGNGYTYYDLSGVPRNVSLEEAGKLIENNEVDIIPGTSASYRGLDFKGLDSILLIQGKLAGVFMQAIGRVARSTNMNIITLNPVPKKKIPIYSKGVIERENSILEYYKYCKINKLTINEVDL